jgi:NAD+ kinase
MNTGPRLLVVAKFAAYDRLQAHDRERLIASGVVNLQRLEEARSAHESALAEIRSQLAPYRVRFRRVDRLAASDVDGIDLVITVGGDGTVFAIQHRLKDTPVLAVNSDPGRSVGHFTRFQVEDFADAFADWQSGDASVEDMARLQVTLEGRSPLPIANDCLFTSGNPAAMSRYRISVTDESGAEQAEDQWSSGVWVATQAGSTGAIASSGLRACPESDTALLFKVREPFTRDTPSRLLEGVQCPPQTLRLTAAATGIECYIDGAHLQVPVAAGETACWTACPNPLRLLAAGGN